MQNFMVNHRRSTSVVADVGWRLKQRREDPAMSQVRLASLLGWSYQQVQKRSAWQKPRRCQSFVPIMWSFER